MISVENLTFFYAGRNQPALSQLNFQVNQGEILGFLGPSGAGKSTTQKILIGLLKGYQGQVRVRGRDLHQWRPADYEHIGVSFEFPNHHLKLTALENLAYFQALYTRPGESPQTVLEMVGLAEDGQRRVSEFSKGMRGRLNLARALLHRPDILFLDEPTAGLDPLNGRRIKDLIRQKREEGCTIFLTTHNMNVADELCDRVAFLVDGQIVLIDNPRALKLAYGRPQVRLEFAANGHWQSQEYPLAGLADNEPFLSLLRSGSVQTIHSQETTLEAIFIELTGRQLT